MRHHKEKISLTLSTPKVPINVPRVNFEPDFPPKTSHRHGHYSPNDTKTPLLNMTARETILTLLTLKVPINVPRVSLLNQDSLSKLHTNMNTTGQRHEDPPDCVCPSRNAPEMEI